MHLPPQLIASWIKILDKLSLEEKAMTKAPKGFEGGMGEEDTQNHLAWRFTGSCARVILSMLDPHEELAEISDTFARIFSGNKVFLADLPCGSGAATVSILSVLCELRKQNRIPRMPLEIVIIGGEISEYAREYAQDALELIVPELKEQAITIDFKAMHWNVRDRFSNTELIKQLNIKSQDSAAKLLILANFSGFLERESGWKEAKDQFDELFRYSRSENSIALWIEPSKNNVTKGFMPRLLKWFKQLFSIIPQINDDEKTYAQSMVQVWHPLRLRTFRNNLTVVRFDLPLQNQS